ncbi:glutathione S-transferase C-terminal domain-containing protein [Burkholderia plantarii]|uniref:glutathione S-transferase C-terminal domain-containing protein n=1 Tax=Burkholderia plantarii TaxID=41899 RepID=UPI0009F1C676|nr:glutathione S-transferase N-terminal domain-containing protein [Burkholderia plantarii]WLE63674.1 glutathione S-transferase N-terminal domain-containing protein [Burkholderia plantarii]
MLKILTDATSPFGRKVVVAAHERALDVRELFIDMKRPEALAPFNPLWQIPALALSDTAGLYDSMAIMLHLDTLHAHAPLVRTGDVAALSMLALADGMMEATLARRVESVRDPARQDDATLARLEARILRSVDTLAARLDELTPERDGRVSGTQIAVAVALEYADFRYGRAWRERAPALAEWLAPLSARPVMAATAPGAREPFESGRRAAS